MINLNGVISSNCSEVLSSRNRSFCYGDGIFETIRIADGKAKNLQRHYFRLMAGMRMMRMNIPMNFTESFVAEEVEKLIDSDTNTVQKIRLTVFRKQGGTYTPENLEIDFLMESFAQATEVKENYTVDIYKDFFVPQGLLSNIKSTNRLLNVLAGIYAKENELDACLLINEQKQVCEATHANFFMVKEGYKIITPPITAGCIKGVMREIVIETLKKHPLFSIEERTISPFEIQKSKEIFLTNAMIGVQPISQYKKKFFTTDIARTIRTLIEKEGYL